MNQSIEGTHLPSYVKTCKCLLGAPERRGKFSVHAHFGSSRKAFLTRFDG
jgi:hypothetical protein